MDKTFDPIARFERYLAKQGWWTSELTKAMEDEHRKVVRAELKRQEKLPLYGVETLFEDTTKEPMPHLKRQMEETIAHYNRNRDVYEKK